MLWLLASYAVLSLIRENGIYDFKKYSTRLNMLLIRC